MEILQRVEVLGLPERGNRKTRVYGHSSPTPHRHVSRATRGDRQGSQFQSGKPKSRMKLLHTGAHRHKRAGANTPRPPGPPPDAAASNLSLAVLVGTFSRDYCTTFSVRRNTARLTARRLRRQTTIRMRCEPQNGSRTKSKVCGVAYFCRGPITEKSPPSLVNYSGSQPSRIWSRWLS